MTLFLTWVPALTLVAIVTVVGACRRLEIVVVELAGIGVSVDGVASVLRCGCAFVC